MIIYKSPEDIQQMRKSCELASSVLDFIEPYVKPGITTEELDKLCHDYIVENGATPSPLNYNGYPKSICTSINHVVCHGIPDSYRLREGDIINVDVSTFLGGFHGDTSNTFAVGKISRAARELISAAREALWSGIRATKAGGHLGDVAEAVQSFTEGQGYSVVREYGGHGIGRQFHEDPHVVHVGKRGTGPELKEGMVFTIEPMINQGGMEVILLDDDWTVETRDRKLSAQFEHTIAITSSGVEVLTLRKDEEAHL